VSSLIVRFNRTCHSAGIAGRLAVDVGEVAESVGDRASWSDVIVIDRSESNENTLHEIIQQASRPVLFVPGPCQGLERALLVYDGSPKTTEPLRS
jgi:hypothetical protein